MHKAWLISLLLFGLPALLLSAGVDTGIVIDSERIDSSLVIRDEYFSADDCLVNNGVVVPGFRRILRFDLALANLGSTTFTTGASHPSEVCSGISGFPNIFSVEVRTEFNSITTVVTQVKTLCLYDAEPSTQDPAGTRAPSATYTICNDTTTGLQGLSVGWQAVYDKNLDTMLVDVTPLLDTSQNPGGGRNYTLKIVFHASNLGNYSDVELDYRFYMPLDHRCFPSPMYSMSTKSSEYVDPEAAGHPLESGPLDANANDINPSVQTIEYPITTFSTNANPLFCYTNESTPQPGKELYVRSNGIVSFETMPTDLVVIDNTDPEKTGNPYYISNTIFPFWDAVFFVNSSYSPIYIYENTSDIIITWVNMDRKEQGSTNPFTFQMRLHSNGDIIFSYSFITSANQAWNKGRNATVGVCAGRVADEDTPLSNIQEDVTNNCVLFSVNNGAKLSVTQSVVFTRTTDTERQLPSSRPVASVTGPTTGSIRYSYTFDASASTISSSGGGEVSYEWIWGDGSVPTVTLTPYANHTWYRVATHIVRVRIFDGLQYSVPTNYSVYMGPYIEPPPTTEGDGGDGSAGYIAVAVILPILFVGILGVLVAVFVVVFLKRHILSKGGAWWEEDPIYLNLEEQQ